MSIAVGANDAALAHNHLAYKQKIEILLGLLKLAEEAGIVLREETQVAHTILQVGDTLHTHTKGVAGIDLRIDVAGGQIVRIDHATTQYLYPTGVLAEATTLATADVAGDIHLCTGLCEGEIAGTKADFRVRSKHLTGKSEEHLL